MSGRDRLHRLIWLNQTSELREHLETEEGKGDINKHDVRGHTPLVRRMDDRARRALTFFPTDAGDQPGTQRVCPRPPRVQGLRDARERLGLASDQGSTVRGSLLWPSRLAQSLPLARSATATCSRHSSARAVRRRPSTCVRGRAS